MGKMYTPEQYEQVMAYKGRVSSMVAARLTGVNGYTIRGWWQGVRPKFMYTEAQRGRPTGIAPPNKYATEAERRAARLATKRRTNARHGKKYELRRRGIYDPVMNPGPVPLHRLWLPGPAVLEFLLARWPADDIIKQLPKESGEYRRFYELRNGKRWIRYDAADDLFIRLGLVVSEMDLDPVESGLVPKEDPCSLVSRAA